MQLRHSIKYIFIALMSAGTAGGVCLALFWNITARNFAKEWYYSTTGAPFRPDVDRFGFDKSLEFQNKPLVELSVNDPQSPNYIIRQGFEVAPHAVGLTYPVNVAFPTNSVPEDDSPFYYIAELHGTIKWVDRQGNTHILTEGLLNFPPTEMKISDEFGISGLAVVPNSADLIITAPVQEEKSKQFVNAVRRIYTRNGGREFDRVETLLTLDGEPTGPSNQIQQVLFGTDEKLYVSVGDAMNWSLSRNTTNWGGKILRINADGTPCSDNPYFQSEGAKGAQNYVYATGLRNSFDFAFDTNSNHIWAGDVGQILNRIVTIDKGADLGWDGTDDAFCREARHVFNDRFVPVGITFANHGVMGDSFENTLWLAGFSNHFGPGPGRSKRLVFFRLFNGKLVTGPVGVVAYKGKGQSTFLGLTQGPDGIYFTDFFGEQETGKADGKGRVMRLTPSQRTLELPVNDKPPGWDGWSQVDRGKYLFLNKGACAKCHTVRRFSSGKEGPDLTHIVTRIRHRLDSQKYQEELAQNAEGRSERHQHAIDSVAAATGTQQLKTWFREHILDPKFDNPRAKMPAYGASNLFEEDELNAVISFLMTLE